jgi:hypothetical protein
VTLTAKGGAGGAAFRLGHWQGNRRIFEGKKHNIEIDKRKIVLEEGIKTSAPMRWQ